MRDLLRRTPAHIILVCAIVAIVDITLFVTWFTDFEEPLVIPSNDFRRLVHTRSPNAKRRHRKGASQSESRCPCQPLPPPPPPPPPHPPPHLCRASLTPDGFSPPTHSPTYPAFINGRAAGSQCQCDPLKSPSALVKCMIGVHGEQQTRIKNQGHRGTILVRTLLPRSHLNR